MPSGFTAGYRAAQPLRRRGNAQSRRRYARKLRIETAVRGCRPMKSRHADARPHPHGARPHRARRDPTAATARKRGGFDTRPGDCAGARTARCCVLRGCPVALATRRTLCNNRPS